MVNAVQTGQNIFIWLIPDLERWGRLCLFLRYFCGLIIELCFMIWVRIVPPVSLKAQSWAKKDISGNRQNGILWKWGFLSLIGHITAPQYIFLVLSLGPIGSFSVCCSLPLCIYVCVCCRPQSGWIVTPVKNVTSLSSGTSSKCGTVRK